MTKNSIKKLRIGFVIDDSLDRPDGVQQYVLGLGKYFASQGHAVKYLSGGKGSKPLKDQINLAKNISVKFNGNSLTIPFFASRRKIRRVVGEQKFDVLHVQIPHSPFFAAKVVSAVGAKTKIIGTFHILPFRLPHKIGTKLLGIILKSNLKKFDEFIAVSNPASQFAKYSFGINAKMIPNFVNLENFKQLPKKTEPNKITLAYLGRLVERKGVADLLSAITFIAENRPELVGKIKVKIAGEGPAKKNLINYTAANGLKNTVEFVGFIPEESKAKFLGQADICVFPARGGESFGIVLLEAMACRSGIVLVADNLGYKSVMQEIPDALFAANNPKQLAKLLEKYIEDSSSRKDLLQKQQRHIEKFDINRVAGEIMLLYGQEK